MHSQETTILNVLIVVAVLVGFLIFYFILSLVRNQRVVVRKNRENLLSEIATLEQERSRVAADLHDELGPLLSQIKFRLSSIDVHDPEDEEQLQLSTSQIDQVVQRIRTISKNLLPSGLIAKGLKYALEESAENLQRYAKLQVTLNYSSTQQLSPQQEINVFRAIQEICQNVVKHAEAKRLLIKVWDEKKSVHFICEDDGKGFDFNAIMKEAKGIGLKNLKNRIDLMSGKFEVMSKQGKGTQTYFIIESSPD